MKKGQFSIEFIVVLGVLLIIISTVSIPLYQKSREDTEKITDMSLARDAVNKLAYSINMAYIEGPGAKNTLEYTLPGGIDNIKVRSSGAPENHLEVLISSSKWGNDNTISVNTLLCSDNHPSIIFENLENMISRGDHNIKVTCELDPETKIKIKEVSE